MRLISEWCSFTHLRKQTVKTLFGENMRDSYMIKGSFPSEKMKLLFENWEMIGKLVH